MNLAILPFSRIIEIPAGTDLGVNASSISLIDAQGSALECNWISISVVSGTIVNDADSYFGMFFSGLSGTPAGVVNDIELTGSASIGIVGSLDMRGSPITYEVFLGDTNRVSEVQIGVGGDDAQVGKFALTYGVKVPINPLRAKDRFAGV